MRSRLTAVAALELACPPDLALPAIWDIRNIERSEMKADRVRVHPDGPKTGTYDVRGRFAGVPWSGRFAYELSDSGFHSRTADVDAASDPPVEGGFVLTPLGATGSTIIHYEQYVLPRWLTPLTPLVRLYLRWSMHRELRIVRALILARCAGDTSRPGEPRDPRVLRDP